MQKWQSSYTGRLKEGTFWYPCLLSLLLFFPKWWLLLLDDLKKVLFGIYASFLSLIVLFNTIHVIQDIFFFLFFFLKPNLQVSVSKARAIIVLASDENADQVPILNVLMLLCGLYRFL